MSAQEILALLRRGEAPGAHHLDWMARGLADGSVSDAQAGAFAMGVCLVGLDPEARTALTLAMRDSGRVLSWDLDGPVLDKHSTGGVGDCVSLVLAPALAASGAYVPMISGRGLGHTGGTLDKLEAIPGVSTRIEEEQFRELVTRAGCAIVGATAEIAPADRRLYAVRDVTSTVDSLDLITASILSKKLAGGLDGLVLDVKVGSGAFMKDIPGARALARALVETANAAGCPASALVSDMSQPLAPALGNALEIEAVMRVLTCGERGALFDLTVTLGALLLARGGLAADEAAGARMISDAIGDGRAAERFGRMIAGLGGPVEFIDNWARFLPEATVIREVSARQSGTVTSIDGEALGLAVVGLGGGRMRETDGIDPAVGLAQVVRLGQRVEKGQPLARVHAARPDAADRAVARIRDAIAIGDEAVTPPELVHERIA
ncbi:thymidine phosphorylase [Sulfitobacter sp. LCG007]